MDLEKNEDYDEEVEERAGHGEKEKPKDTALLFKKYLVKDNLPASRHLNDAKDMMIQMVKEWEQTQHISNEAERYRALAELALVIKKSLEDVEQHNRKGKDEQGGDERGCSCTEEKEEEKEKPVAVSEPSGSQTSNDSREEEEEEAPLLEPFKYYSSGEEEVKGGSPSLKLRLSGFKLAIEQSLHPSNTTGEGVEKEVSAMPAAAMLANWGNQEEFVILKGKYSKLEQWCNLLLSIARFPEGDPAIL